MVRILDPTAAKGYAAQYAPDHVVGLASVLVAVAAIVAIAVFSCAKKSDSELPNRPGNRGDGVTIGGDGGGGGCGGGG
jgi:uncharacterized membrane protein YgcG